VNEAAAASRAALAAPARARPTLREATRVWAEIALLSFGGPAGQIALMHRILVDERRWISERRFLHALNFCMLLPGPEAQQLATYVGWLMNGTRGGLVAGGLFVLPGIVAIMALSIVYAAYGATAIVTALFFGLKAAVLAIVLEALARIARRSLREPALVILAGAAFVGIFFLQMPFPFIVLGAGTIGYVGHRLGFLAAAQAGDGKQAEPADDSVLGETLPPHTRPDLGRTLRVTAAWLALWLIPVTALLIVLGPDNVFAVIAVFFSKMALVTFGGAYAVLAYVAQQAVDGYHWLRPGEMLDGLGMAETTPGPLIMVLQFVGFLAAFRHAGALPPMLAGVLGGLLTTFVTFVPCFLWIFAGAPYVEAIRSRKALSAALAGITAAVVGVILNLAVWFAIHACFAEVRPLAVAGLSFDAPVLASMRVWAVVLALAAIVAVFRFRLGVIVTLVLSSAAGIGLHFAGAV
jgi:chromate transporter